VTTFRRGMAAVVVIGAKKIDVVPGVIVYLVGYIQTRLPT
jgi:hypothetical protein